MIFRFSVDDGFNFFDFSHGFGIHLNATGLGAMIDGDVNQNDGAKSTRHDIEEGEAENIGFTSSGHRLANLDKLKGFAANLHDISRNKGLYRGHGFLINR